VSRPALTQYSVTTTAHTTPPSERAARDRRVAAFLTASDVGGVLDPEPEAGVVVPDGGALMTGIIGPVGSESGLTVFPPFADGFFFG
jgi:hypothetical protein